MFMIAVATKKSFRYSNAYKLHEIVLDASFSEVKLEQNEAWRGRRGNKEHWRAWECNVEHKRARNEQGRSERSHDGPARVKWRPLPMFQGSPTTTPMRNVQMEAAAKLLKTKSR